MTILQDTVSHWLSTLFLFLPVGYAVGAGMIAAVNPCGFPMLPAYLSLYLGSGEPTQMVRSPILRLGHAAMVGTSVSAGFTLLFAIAGLVISAGGQPLVTALPWIGELVGVVLVLVGLGMLFGRTWSPPIFERLADRIHRPADKSVRGFVLFGVAYGLASLSCTLPVFLIVVGNALTQGDVVGSMASFLEFTIGMALVVVSLTLSLAIFTGGLVQQFRRALPVVQRASAMLVIVAGTFIVAYWVPNL